MMKINDACIFGEYLEIHHSFSKSHRLRCLSGRSEIYESPLR